MYKFFLLLAVFILTPHIAYACSCGKSTAENSYLRAPVVVSAKVVEHVGSENVKLEFTEIWKGVAPQTVIAKLQTGFSSFCGSTGFTQSEIGQDYLLYLNEPKKDEIVNVHFSPCARHGTLEKRKQDISIFKEYQNELMHIRKNTKTQNNSKEHLLEEVAHYQKYNDLINAKLLLEQLTTLYDAFAPAWLQYANVVYQQAENTPLPGSKGEKHKNHKIKRNLYQKALSAAQEVITLDKKNTDALSIIAAASIHLGQEKTVSFKGVSLTNTNFKYKNFTNKDFSNTNFSNTSFIRTQLKDSTISGANFEKSSFYYSNFENLKITDSNFTSARINKSTAKNLKHPLQYTSPHIGNSTISESIFQGVSFRIPLSNTQIENSNFKNTAFFGGYSKDGAEIVIMDNVKASNTSFDHATVSHNGFTLGTIKNSTFKGSSFDGAKISTQLINNDFSNANLKGIDLTGSQFDCKTKWPKDFNPTMHGAVPAKNKCGALLFEPQNFEGIKFPKYRSFGPINLEGANFHGADLTGASFRGAILKNADFTDANVKNADFRNANLEGAKFKNMSLYSVSLEGANLKDTIFSGAHFSRTNVKNTNINEANLTLARIGESDVKNMQENFEPSKHQFIYWANRRGQGDPNPCLTLDKRPINMQGEDLTGINLSYGCMHNANLKNTVLNKANLYNTDLTGANLDGAKFIGSLYSCHTVLPNKYSQLYEHMISDKYSSCRR